MLVICTPLLFCASTPSLLLPAVVTEMIVPALLTMPLTPGRTASASNAFIRPVEKLLTVLAPDRIALKSTTCEPPADAFNDIIVP